ncbi:Sporulation integral membrane protein YlbJ [compost metagenome]
MKNIIQARPRLISTLAIAMGAVMVLTGVLLAPEEVFKASSQGLKLWWTIVFPAMLPFLMLSEMLLALGIVHGLGVLLSPLMRSSFRLPGHSGWVLALGMTAGAPASAEAIRQLTTRDELGESQARLLTALTHFNNPMTIILVIGTGFLHSPALGYLLLIVHWGAGIAAGLILLRGSSSINAVDNQATSKQVTDNQATDNKTSSHHASSPAARTTKGHSYAEDSFVRLRLHTVLTEMRLAREQDGRSFGKLLGDTVTNAVQTLMISGGFILFFAVISQLFSLYVSSGAFSYVWPALLELHLGSYALTTALGSSPLTLAGISAILGWGGLSGWFQSVAITRPADRGRLLAWTRLWHGLIAFVLTLILWRPWQRLMQLVQPAYGTDTLLELTGTGKPMDMSTGATIPSLWQLTAAPWMLGTLILTVLLLLSMTIYASRRLFSR